MVKTDTSRSNAETPKTNDGTTINIQERMNDAYVFGFEAGTDRENKRLLRIINRFYNKQKDKPYSENMTAKLISRKQFNELKIELQKDIINVK